MRRYELTPPVFAIFAALIEGKSGIHHRLHDRELLAEKLAGPAAEAGFDSLLDYYYFLKYDPGGEAALDELVDAITVNETYFFRELDPLAVVVDEVIAPRVLRHGRARVWSAACSTGEEPLSLAMLLADRGLLDRCSILASDVSRRALARAAAGRYSRRALRAEPPAQLARYLRREGEVVEVDAALRAAVELRRVNLADAQEVASLGPFDVILCRNVLIYFDEPTARRVVDALTNQLELGGCLLVGVTESLLRFGTRLRCEEIRGTFVYVKES